MDANFGFDELGVDPAGNFTNPIPFSSLLSDNEASELPAGEAELELLVGIATFTNDVSWDAPTNVPVFRYVEAGTVIAINSFTVPEPAAWQTGLTALLSLGAVARHRRRA
jgi:MYXO-CTERM domain-containing protein